MLIDMQPLPASPQTLHGYSMSTAAPALVCAAPASEDLQHAWTEMLQHIPVPQAACQQLGCGFCEGGFEV